MLHSTRCQLQLNAILCSHECSFVWWSITTFSSISDRIVCGNQSVHTRYHTGMPRCSFVQLLCCALHLWITIFDCTMLRHQLVFITKQVCQIVHVCTSAMWVQDVATRLRSVTKRYFQLWLMTLRSQSDLLFLAYKNSLVYFSLPCATQHFDIVTLCYVTFNDSIVKSRFLGPGWTWLCVTV